MKLSVEKHYAYSLVFWKNTYEKRYMIKFLSFEIQFRTDRRS